MVAPTAASCEHMEGRVVCPRGAAPLRSQVARRSPQAAPGDPDRTNGDGGVGEGGGGNPGVSAGGVGGGIGSGAGVSSRAGLLIGWVGGGGGGSGGGGGGGGGGAAAAAVGWPGLATTQWPDALPIMCQQASLNAARGMLGAPPGARPNPSPGPSGAPGPSVSVAPAARGTAPSTAGPSVGELHCQWTTCPLDPPAVFVGVGVAMAYAWYELSGGPEPGTGMRSLLPYTPYPDVQVRGAGGRGRGQKGLCCRGSRVGKGCRALLASGVSEWFWDAL